MADKQYLDTAGTKALLVKIGEMFTALNDKIDALQTTQIDTLQATVEALSTSLDNFKADVKETFNYVLTPPETEKLADEKLTE